jgi:predicted nucleic acid-binding Zn finger protein
VKKKTENVDSVVSSKGVKLHYFEPSKRQIWTVVGKDNEHWLDPEMGFCSCEDYYYNAIDQDRECYHLKAVRIAREKNDVEMVKFSDLEFENFMTAIIEDNVV